ncbi:hypothetical protein BOX15_Mlig016362g5, partial [Macrostomum lignano]
KLTMLFQSIRFAVSISILMTVATVGAEDQHCIEKPVNNISVEIGGDNPQRVMTYIRDEPGYQVNLQCKWTLQPANYDKPRQMYIRVPVIDFDTNDVSEAQCNVSNTKADVFSLKLKLNDTTYRNESWCSNKSVKVKSQIVNLWDSSYKLALEFRSDDKQVRSNAKGVQVDVQVLGRDYCHRTMLFFEGSCYLITPERLTPAEAFSIAKNYLGNVFTVPKNRNNSEFFRPFIQRNSDRAGEFPFESPLRLTGSMWTGYFIDILSSSPPAVFKSAQYCDPQAGCGVALRNFSVFFKSSSKFEYFNRCAVAMHWGSGGSVNFTCESMESKLPAMIELKQIPATKGDLHPQLFTTCDTLPSFRLFPTTTRPQEQQLNLQRQQLSLQRQQLSLMQQQLSLQQQQLSLQQQQLSLQQQQVSLLLQQFNLQEQQLNIQYQKYR